MGQTVSHLPATATEDEVGVAPEAVFFTGAISIGLEPWHLIEESFVLA